MTAPAGEAKMSVRGTAFLGVARWSVWGSWRCSARRAVVGAAVWLSFLLGGTNPRTAASRRRVPTVPIDILLLESPATRSWAQQPVRCRTLFDQGMVRT